jgi:hypothetical protein
MDHVPATFVLAGINVENCGFLTGNRGQQLARRFTQLKASPSNYSTIPQRRDWAQLIDGFERALRLRAHKPGSLLPLADYLYGRTGGYIVSLSHLIREAAIKAILSGTSTKKSWSLWNWTTPPLRKPQLSVRASKKPQAEQTMSLILPPPRQIPVLPRPRHGELSGSYLARVARANGINLHTYAGLVGRLPSPALTEGPDLAIMVLTLNDAAFTRLLAYTGLAGDNLIKAIPSLKPRTFKSPGESPAIRISFLRTRAADCPGCTSRVAAPTPTPGYSPTRQPAFGTATGSTGKIAADTCAD